MHATIQVLTTLYLSYTAYAYPSLRSLPGGPIVKDSNYNISYQGTSTGGVESFLNIKFGQDTGGAHRFAAPLPFVYENGSIVNASKPGAACPQQKIPVQGFNVFSNVTNFSEDCLTLRIDRAENTTADARLPVMLWIYGGGDTIGQIYDQSYDPKGLVLGSLAKGKPVIYAAVNYRLGFLGWSAFRGNDNTTAVPNAGLHDQRLGIEWIQKHIASFGGDPDNITVFGESDGATGIGLQITAYGGAQPVSFKRAILESGSPLSDSNTVGNFTWDNSQRLAMKLNCTSSDIYTTVECLRELSLTEILPTVIKFELAVDSFSGFNVFEPVVDGTFVPAAPSELLRSGNYSTSTPIIIGWNENDGALFVGDPSLYANSSYIASWVSGLFEAINSSQVQEALAMYNASSFAAESAAYPAIPIDWWRASQIMRDSSFTCPSLFMAESLAQHGNTSAYLFTLNETLFAPFLAQKNESFEGVVHFSDIPFVFNQAVAYNASQAEVLLASQISGSWAEFAYSGQPTAMDGAANQTVSDWPLGVEYTPGCDSYTIRVLGGPHDGVVHAGVHLGMEDFEDLGRRCEFWNSPEIQRAVGV